MKLGILLSLFVGSLAQAGNVIFITVDGVRREDAKAVFGRSAPLYFKTRVANKVAISLPGYRALFTGNFETECTKNVCDNIDRETLIDRQVNEGIDLNRIAAFASWNQIRLAIESKPRIFRAIAGEMERAPASMPASLKNTLDTLNEQAKGDLPEWPGAIKDEYTWSMAMQYLHEQQPSFLYVGLLDTDEWAHAKKRKKYFEALRLVHRRIELLRARLDKMGDYGANTSIVLTTDHGRGRWPFFSGHGKGLPHSFHSWIRIYPSPAAAQNGTLDDYDPDSQADVRAAIEQLLKSQ